MAKNQDFFCRIMDRLGLPAEASRRGFLLSALGVTGVTAAMAWSQKSAQTPFVILENAEGILVTDATRCVGCRRCELACTEYLDGRAQPALARIKLARNYNFGPRGQRQGFSRSAGEFGNFRMLPDTCLQCPHPVPCSVACPHDAIVADGKIKARRIDSQKCTGCRLCLHACPWEMITFDDNARKASKCFLCEGKPECAEACPALALRYVSWRDLTRDTPVRQAVPASLRDPKAAACIGCH
jgi:Fe-S-cluster-containing dehydrogenase component